MKGISRGVYNSARSKEYIIQQDQKSPPFFFCESYYFIIKKFKREKIETWLKVIEDLRRRQFEPLSHIGQINKYSKL